MSAGERSLRVIAGRLRGRRLHAAPGRDTRPTSARARAGLFDWLGPRLSEARVLDLYAGTGALGIESLSRGAASAVFVERDPAACGALRRNLRELGLEAESRVLARDVLEALARLPAGAFDLVFADPPWHGDDGERLLEARALAERLAPGAALVLERSARDPVAPACKPLALVVSRSFGETRFDRYETSEESP